jgi:hypothetical protein
MIDQPMRLRELLDRLNRIPSVYLDSIVVIRHENNSYEEYDIMYVQDPESKIVLEVEERVDDE